MSHRAVGNDAVPLTVRALSPGFAFTLKGVIPLSAFYTTGQVSDGDIETTFCRSNQSSSIPTLQSKIR